MERTVILRYRATGVFLGAAGVTFDPHAALAFPTAADARRFMERHACEPDTLELVDGGRPAAA